MTIHTIPEPVAIDGGWRVRETGRYFVDVLPMFVNTRIVITPKTQPGQYERGWCYPGHDITAAVLRCFTFDPDAGEEPEGWVKEAGTERRCCSAYWPAGPHDTYVAECMKCGVPR